MMLNMFILDAKLKCKDIFITHKVIYQHLNQKSYKYYSYVLCVQKSTIPEMKTCESINPINS